MSEAADALAKAERSWAWLTTEPEARRMGADSDVRDALRLFWAAGGSKRPLAEQNRAATLALDLRAWMAPYLAED